MLMFGDDLSIYKEVPVDIDTFISDPMYLGRSTRNGESIYPFWKDKLNEVFNTPDSFQKQKDMIVLNTAIGVGKTRFSVIGLLYLLYNYMCLKDPIEYFKLSPDSKLSIVFVLKSLIGANSVAYSTFLGYISVSTWFCEHGEIKVNRRSGDIRDYFPDSPITIVVANKKSHTLGMQPFGAYIDRTIGEELSNDDLMFDLRERCRSRFEKDGVFFSKIFVDNELDFDNRLACSKYSELWFSIRGSQWEIKPNDLFSDETIPIVVNPVIGKSYVIWDKNVVPKLEENEHIIEVPNNFKFEILATENNPEDFSRHILMQLAGECQTIYEKNVSFSDAMDAMLNHGMAIRMEYHSTHYFVINNTTVVDDNLRRIDISNVSLFSDFIKCNNWEVCPSCFVKLK